MAIISRVLLNQVFFRLKVNVRRCRVFSKIFFDVQLFISTHSYEMLEYLQKAIENQPQEDKTHWQEQLSLFSFVKLNKTPSSYYHDYDSFNELVKSKWELR